MMQRTLPQYHATLIASGTKEFHETQHNGAYLIFFAIDRSSNSSSSKMYL
jgi:hypothetical protein